MSDISLYAGLYEQIREYAELVDEVLIGLISETSLPHDVARQKLGKFLVNLAEKQPGDLLTQRMALTLRATANLDRSKYLSVGNALLSEKVDNSVIELLENLARTLEDKQVGVMAKMRGSIR